MASETQQQHTTFSIMGDTFHGHFPTDIWDKLGAEAGKQDEVRGKIEAALTELEGGKAADQVVITCNANGEAFRISVRRDDGSNCTFFRNEKK